MGNIQVISRGAQWIVIQRGNLEDISAHMTLDEAVSAARDVAATRHVNLVLPQAAAIAV